MRCITIPVILLLLLLTLSCLAQAELIAWWNFDEGRGRSVKDSVSGEVDEIRGNYWYAEGVSGSCLKLDGYTTHVVRSADVAPWLGDDFTIEADGVDLVLWFKGESEDVETVSIEPKDQRFSNGF